MLGEQHYDPDPLLDLGISFINPAEIPAMYRVNPYVSLMSGHTYVQRAGAVGEDIIQYVDTATAPTAEEGGDNPAFLCVAGLCRGLARYLPGPEL